MDKVEFIQRLEATLVSRIGNLEKFWQGEIRRQKEMKDRPSWIAWLKEQRDEAVATSEGVINGTDKYYSRENPAENAQIFANLVEFDTHEYNPQTDSWEKGSVDWNQLWTSAQPFLANVEKRQDPTWKWRANFTFMLKIMDAAQKAKVFNRQIDSILDREKFTEHLEAELRLIPIKIESDIRETLEKLQAGTKEGFEKRLKQEEEKHLNAAALHYKVRHPNTLAFKIAELYDQPEVDWNAAWNDALQFMNPHPLIKDYIARLEAETWLIKIKQILEAPESATLRKGKKITQKQLAIFYHTLQALNAYPAFGNDGRTIEEHYREVGKRHGVSAGNFKKNYLGTKSLKTITELLQLIPLNQLEELANLLPDSRKFRDLLKIEKAKTLKK